MRTEEIKIFTITELSEDAQRKAHKNWLNAGNTYNWADENNASLKKFAELFRIEIRDFNYSYQRYINYSDSSIDDDILNLKGARLMAYLWNNYSHEIYKGKYLGHLERPAGFYHRMAKSSFKNKDGAQFYRIQSNIRIEIDSPFTGYCADMYLLSPIEEFLTGPVAGVDITFKELINTCLNSWVEGCTHDYEHSQTLEYFLEEAESNDYEYTEDGKRY